MLLDGVKLFKAFGELKTNTFPPHIKSSYDSWAFEADNDVLAGEGGRNKKNNFHLLTELERFPNLGFYKSPYLAHIVCDCLKVEIRTFPPELTKKLDV